MSSRASASEIPFLAVLIIFGSVTANACDACAQDLPNVELPCAPEVTENRRAVVANEGDSGVWFHIEVARCMLGRLSALPEYARQLRLHEDRLELTDANDALLRRQVSLAVQEADAARGALEAAVRRAREAEESRDAWYRNPGFWFVVGTVVVIALEVVAVWAFSQVRISI